MNGPHIEELISEAALAARISELGEQITQDYAGQELVCVGVLKGSFLFMADLVRKIKLPLSVDFLGLSSYGEKTVSSGVVKITQDFSNPIEGKSVLVVEDIIDTGLTMQYLLANLATRKPHSVRICTLLHKPANQRVPVPIDYTGFTIDNYFVVGYGLDLAELYRNLPYIGHIVKQPGE
jgi:hypoxanthine phosphoribosyltransferase